MPPRKAPAMENVGVVDFPTDVLVDILSQLPTSSRRLCRLVCRRWRDTIDKRTPERDVRTKMLTFVKGLDNEASAYVVDEARGRHRRVWTSSCSVDVIGTRNGLICVLDGGTGAVTVANPATRESLPVPPPPPRQAGLLPCSPDARTHEAYGFAFHPATLRYAVVHVPFYFNKSGTFDAVHVYTLGRGGRGAPPSWRSVPTPGASGRFQPGGVACVDGVAYWITAGTPAAIMSLDLKDNRVAPVKWSPETPGRGCRCSYRLTEMRGRLCVAVTVEETEKPTKRVEVWWMESTRDQRWTRRYNIMLETPKQHVMWPLFAHGENVLTVAQVFKEYNLHKHKVSDKRSSQCSMVKIWKKKPGVEIMNYGVADHTGISTFAYMETSEPLEIYK
uniref:F-box domain-containing protein n=1 Tax=Oryza glumipatula TaxID=40148 RepID=A0A0E0AWZ9_9ORYZ